MTPPDTILGLFDTILGLFDTSRALGRPWRHGKKGSVLCGLAAGRLFSANPLLRDELMIKPRYLYFVAIVEDFILR